MAIVISCQNGLDEPRPDRWTVTTPFEIMDVPLFFI